jgi:hypothetical protein
MARGHNKEALTMKSFHARQSAPQIYYNAPSLKEERERTGWLMWSSVGDIGGLDGLTSTSVT